MNDVGQESRGPGAGTVGALCGSGDLTQRSDYGFVRCVAGGTGKNGLGALLRSKANPNLGREEPTQETLACYSTSTLGGALAKSKGS
jgi:hypothetical protein